jgi:DNA-binding Lrp family transcriptional regulator
VQNRISSLERSGCILGYYAWVSLEALGGVRAIIFGQMDGMLDEDMLKAIENNGSIIVVMTGSQNHLYLWANLRDISDLDGFQKVAQIDCKIAEPEVLIIGPGSLLGLSSNLDKTDRPPVETLKTLDYQIICSLHKNARKSISKVAEDVGASTKTVRKHLSRLIENDLIEFFVRHDPRQQEELFSFIIIKISSITFRNEVLENIKRDLSSYVSFCLTFSNKPNLLIFEMITQSVGEFRDKLEDLKGYEGVESIAWDLCQNRYQFQIWRDRLLDDKKQEFYKSKRVITVQEKTPQLGKGYR